jgi:ABC-type glycerol-3-phosphate transport system substrate-binding protein
MTMNTKLLMAVAGAALVLAACGGGGGDGDGDSRGDDDTVPASALESPQSFRSFVRGGSAFDNKEPLPLLGVLLPLLDTLEPIDIN